MYIGRVISAFQRLEGKQKHCCKLRSILYKFLDRRSQQLSGKEAITKISERRYDIVFMDHMMPELDGVETTHIIRRFHPEYNDVPIIALTANAMNGTREVFLAEGMNDFIAKPVELKTLISKVGLAALLRACTSIVYVLQSSFVSASLI